MPISPKSNANTSDLLAMQCPHYARADQEGRTLLHETFTTAGDVWISGGELQLECRRGEVFFRLR